MNNRFKFRVWDKERKCFFNDDEVVIYPNGEESFFNADYDFTECVVEQCTELRDKNGKLIYENDLIKIDDDVAVIKWSDYYARFMLESQEDNFDFETTYAEECEVIGNIHKNANLLEVNND